MNGGLPEGWALVELRDCAEVLDNLRVPVNSDERAKRRGRIPYYGATGQVGWIDDFLFDEELVLIGEDGAPFFDKSKPIAYLVRGKSWVNNHAHVLRARSSITANSYLKYLLDAFDFHGYVNGTTRLKLTQGSMIGIPVRLAPYAEQRRIIAKLEELLSKVDVCQKRLAKIPVLLKRFRQSVLAAACSGRLTEDWREESAATDAATKGVPDTKDVPVGWKPVVVGDVIDEVKYGTAQKCSYEKRGVPVLRIPNVVGGTIDHSDLKYAHLPSSEAEQLRLRPGDILVVRSNGSVALVGKSALVGVRERDFAYAGYLLRLRPNHGMVDPRFLDLALGSYGVRLQIELQARSTSGVNNINSEEVRGLRFLLPPLVEQAEVVRRVDALFAVADRVEERYAASKKLVDQLTPSILARAFRGELVPPEAELAAAERRDYESASVLLERILQERSAKDGEGDRTGPEPPGSSPQLDPGLSDRRHGSRPRRTPSGHLQGEALPGDVLHPVRANVDLSSGLTSWPDDQKMGVIDVVPARSRLCLHHQRFRNRVCRAVEGSLRRGVGGPGGLDGSDSSPRRGPC